MAGANINPIGVINQIADNLRDRYDNGFPVLKEIIQNSDDAQADSLVIGWCTGIENPDNPLLAGPGLFFINDAPLEEEHERGIRSIAESTKASSKSSVGKFGLGMKSLFHLCEAFFYQANNWREHSWAGEVFNPWGEDYRPDWHNYTESDKTKIERKLKPIIDDFIKEPHSPWFLVWVPLRVEEQAKYCDNELIINNLYSETSPPDFLRDEQLKQLPVQISEIFPLLKKLKSVEFVIESGDKFRDLFQIKLNDGSNRSHFIGEECLSSGKLVDTCKGKVLFEADQTTSEVSFGGVEKLLGLTELNELQNVDKGWPVSYQYDPKSKRPIKALDKAEQHVAVVISKSPAKGKAYVNANWAVFLPLADTSELKKYPIDGEFDYNFYLHGYFFVDAGRRGIHGHDSIGTEAKFDEIGRDEKLLRAAWNITLANKGTLDLVIDALEFFVKTSRLTKAEIEQINIAIKNIFPDIYHKKITQNNQWVYQIGKEKRSWVKHTIENQFRRFPQPKNNDYSRLWDTFARLEEFSSYIFIEANRPNLISGNLSAWKDAELKQLLEIDVTKVFSSSVLLDYLVDFIQLNTEQMNFDVRHSLVSPVIKKALENVELKELSGNTKLVKGLVSSTLSKQRFSVNVSANEQRLWNSINKANTEIQCIPAFLDAEQYNSDGKLTENEAISLLTEIDAFLNGFDDGSSETKTAETIVRDILTHLKKNSSIQMDAVYERCSDLRLFKVENIHTNKSILISLNQLKTARERYTLYIRSGVSSYGKGRELVKATQDLDIYFIAKSDAEVLFGEDKVPECSARCVLKALATNAPDLGSELDRKVLITSLSGTSELTNQDIKGFRYLLHGVKEDDLAYDLWKQPLHSQDVWTKLWRLSENIKVPKWCLISDNLSGALNDDLNRALSVKEISSTDVLQRVQEELPYFDYDSFTQYDFDELLKHIHSEAIWKSVPVHLFADGSRGCIDERCIIATSESLPSAFSVKQVERSKEPMVERQQLKWVGEIGPAKLIELAFHQENIHSFSEFILEQINHLKSLNNELDEQIYFRLMRDKWLYTEGGKEVAPNSLIKFDPAEWPEVSILCEKDDSDCFSLTQIAARLKTGSKKAALLKLADHIDKKHAFIFNCASQYPEYAIGKIKSLRIELIKQVIDNRDILEIFPGWKLVGEFFDNYHNKFDVSPALMLQKEVDSKLLVATLRRLADKASPADHFLIREQLLTALCHCEDGLKKLASIGLRTQANDYQIAGELTRDVTGVSPHFVIHDDELSVIANFLPEGINTRTSIPSRGEASNQSSPVETFREYFSSWGREVPPDAIAMFLSVVSGDKEIKALAEQFFRNKTHQGTLDVINRVWDARTRGPFSGMPIGTVISSNRFSPSILGAGKGRVTSLFGEEIEVPLTEKASSLVVLQKNKNRGREQSHIIQLRRIDLNDFDKQQLLRLLKESAEAIISQIYGQPVRLDALWKDLGASNQLDIKLAKRMVLEKIVPTLERLRIKEYGIDKLLLAYSRAQRYFIESGQSGRDEVNKVTSDIQKKIENDSALQANIMASVKHEIGFHAQYLPSSVPFELFQNADDAIGEKYLMDGEHDDFNHQPPFWIKLDKTNNHIEFYHWGREINYCKVGYTQGEGKFERDLEKMVSLNISDKSETATGKFGLGFKSCLLICDEPQIVSGDICFNIQAGILPVTSPQSDELFKLSESCDLKGQTPTIVRLPLNNEFSTRTTEILERFREASGVLCVFSRYINTIRLDAETVTWERNELSKIPNLYVGSTKLPEKESLRNQKVLHYKAKSGQLLFRLRRDGFISFSESKLSKFWVLNPLQEDLPAGFIIEANFQVDIGRSQLAKSNEANIRVMGELGQDLASLLRQLHEWAEGDWYGFKNELGFDESLTKERFWASLWNVLTEGWPQALFKPESKAVLFKQLFIQDGGLLDFYKQVSLVPNQLSGKTTLISLQGAKYVADGLLTATCQHISRLKNLQSLIGQGEIISNKVGDFMDKIDVRLERRSVSDIVREYLEGSKIFPEHAEVFGQLFNEQFENLMCRVKANYSETEVLKRDLKLIKFENKRGSWSEANELLYFGERLTSSEELIKDFSSDEGVLSEDYCLDGRKFFDFCQTTKPNKYFNWAHNIQHGDLNKQKSLIKYILLPEGASLFDRLKDNPPGWMNAQNLDPALMKNKWKLSASEIEIFHSRWSDTYADLTRKGQQRINKDSISQLEPKEALQNIFNWWQLRKDELLPEYEKKMYPQGVFDWDSIIQDDLTQVETRKSWLKLLYLGSCQTIGRTKEVQHRGAVEWFEVNGWWDIFAVPDKTNADAWFKVIDEYLDYSLTKEQYRNWLQLLPIYRFSRDLDDYVELLWSSEHFLEHLDDFLSPGTSAALEGTGMSVPVLKATLGIGTNFVFRELIRNKVFDAENLKRFSYVPSLKVRELFSTLQCQLDANSWAPYQSTTIYDFVEKHLGEECATFSECFDIPFRILMSDENQGLREELLGIGFNK
ncbi:hypothetical protein ABXV24_15790 [Vibrio owensii]|uniref:sacsin N-terminal ATP-binding-like domain-containing protein n=1 Tax=Vibrio owensii TaxID=696485 RepID=UPI0033981DBA